MPAKGLQPAQRDTERRVEHGNARHAHGGDHGEHALDPRGQFGKTRRIIPVAGKGRRQAHSTTMKPCLGASHSGHVQ
jgi:hypothetical protein